MRTDLPTGAAAPDPGAVSDGAGSRELTAETAELGGEPTVAVTPGLPVPGYPIVMTPPVESLIGVFTARDRERFGLWIARSGRYLGMIQRVFRERGLPEDLAYTAMIESGFSPRAVSRVGATGMWQFMEGTARRYGLVVNRWVDERLDPVKATVAAAQYLGDLYGMFGHWFLAQAAYNAGEARVAKAIQRAGSNDFWALTQTPHLPDETKLFVPQILAAAAISREPDRYGFAVDPDPPLAYDEVTVNRSLDLETVARLAGVGPAEVRDLNPALVARVTPPSGGFTLRLPVGTVSAFRRALDTTPAEQLPVWGIHRVSRSQTLVEIARLYRTSPQRLVDVNRLAGARLKGIAELIVPVSNRAALAAPAPPSSPKSRPALSARAAGGAREVVVRRGDTLATIAARHGVKPLTLARLNGRDPEGHLPVGTRLRLVTP
jgi:membrane-bound lytic murein transglycosylase D